MATVFRGFSWIVVYVLVALAPLLVARLGTPPAPRGFVTDFSVALALIGMSIMVLQFGLVARFQRVSAPFGMDALHQFHRQIAYLALALVLSHPILIFIQSPATLELLNPVTAPNRARYGLAAVVVLLVLAVSSFFRKKLRIKYEWWQAAHGTLATAVIVLAFLHARGWGRYMSTLSEKITWAVMLLGLAGIVLWLRLIRPLLHLRRPWRVKEVVEERGNAWTVVMEPVGHPGLQFVPGQFGWVLLGRSPFRITQHPFSFSSSAEAPGGEVTMTIKSRGDFTRTVRDIEPGTRAYIDGPYGLFSTDRNEGRGFVLIAGGVGITPLISMVRTMRDRDDQRPTWLFYGNKDYETVTFREELDALTVDLKNLRVVHVLEQSHDGWDGETGFIDAEMLRRHLPERFDRLQYFVCGPVPMMDAMEDALVAIGVEDERIHTERFDVV